jgi:hypothetical protein
MNHDEALKRAKNALQVTSGNGTPATVDHGKIDAVLARARAAAEDRPRPVVVAAPPKPVVAPPPKPAAAPAVAIVHLQMVCSATGKSFIGIAERRGSELRLVGHQAQSKQGGEIGHTEMLSGGYTFAEDNGWACPFCRMRSASIWTCMCSEFRGVLHCGGSVGAREYCACGMLEKRTSTNVPSVDVCGEAVVTRSVSLSGHCTGGASLQGAPVSHGGVPRLVGKS